MYSDSFRSDQRTNSQQQPFFRVFKMLMMKHVGCNRLHLKRTTDICRIAIKVQPRCQDITQTCRYYVRRSSSLDDGKRLFMNARLQDCPSFHSYPFKLVRKSSTTSRPHITIESLQSRVSELERTTSHRRLNKLDVENEIWPMLTECAASDPSNTTEKCIEKAKLANRLLELCLREVDEYRVHLWRWIKRNELGKTIQTDDVTSSEVQDATSSPGVLKQMYKYLFPNGETTNAINLEESSDRNGFTPSIHWKHAPHPSKQMYNLAFSSWRNVIESTHSSSSKLFEVTENAARQISSLLSTMEDDFASDEEFVNAYNDAADKTRYAQLSVGAAIPDITTYGEVMNAWGRCVGSFLRPDKNRKAAGDTSFEHRLRLEASAIKAIMELKESMGDGLIQSYNDNSAESKTSAVKDMPAASGHRPPLDKACYNIILTTMSRRINPSIAEMRLVIQEMMERVMNDLEYSDHELDEEDPDSHPSMECFPDVISYNALIEARASRSAMFASDMITIQRHIRSDHLFKPIDIPHHEWGKRTTQSSGPWQHWCQQNSESHITSQKRRKFTASEEEAIFAEQILDEMCNLATMPVRPNVFSYNSVIKAWINAETERGLQRAILILRALTMAKDGGNSRKEEISSSALERLSDWSSKLLNKTLTVRTVGGELEIDYLAFETETTRAKSETNRHQQHHFVATNPRIALMNAAMNGNGTAHRVRNNQTYEPIGPLPHIEPSVNPDLRTFKMILAALERNGSVLAAKLSEDLVTLLEESCVHLTPDASIYNLVLKGWMQASKDEDEQIATYAAKRTQHLLDKMITRAAVADSGYPRPDETSFMMTINSCVNAASRLFSAGDYPHAVHAIKQAESLLEKMTDRPVESREIAISCFGAVARAWADLSGNPKHEVQVSLVDRAHGIIEKMTKVSNGMHLELLPFNAVLDAWARELATRPRLQNSEHIIATLSNMHDFFMRMVGEHEMSFNVTVDRSSFNHMLRACYAPLTSKSKCVSDTVLRQILDLVLDIYSQMNHSTYRPDAHTYLHLLKATNYLLSADGSDASRRSKLSRTLFQDCCEHGQLTGTTFWFANTAFSKDPEFIHMLHSLSGVDKEQLSNTSADRLYRLMPSEWSRFGHRVKSLNKFQKGNKSKPMRYED